MRFIQFVPGSAAALSLACLALTLAATLAATPASAESDCNITINAGEQGDITARRGADVAVCLPINSGTGYSWQVQMGGDAMTLKPTPTVERSGTMPGSPAVTRFTMKPQAAGDYTLVFMLVPPGMTGAEQGRAFVGLHVK